MKGLLTTVLVLCALTASAQFNYPTAGPMWFYLARISSPAFDTTTYSAAQYPGILQYRQQPGDTAYWFSNGARYVKVGGAGAVDPSQFIQNQIFGSLTENFWIDGDGRTSGTFTVTKNGLNTYSPSLRLLDDALGLGANFQLTGGTVPGLALWIHDGNTGFQRRLTVAGDNGNVIIGNPVGTYGALQVGGAAYIVGSLRVADTLEMFGQVRHRIRAITTDVDVTVLSTDYTILLQTPNTGTTQNITLPNPITAGVDGRMLVFIENSSDTWNLNYTVIDPGGPAFDILPANTTTIVQAINGSWYKIK